MPQRETPPFRADHVGSLLRPRALLDARQARADGVLSVAELRTAEDAAIRNVVDRQERLGLQSATDGEFRRSAWHMDFISRLGGVVPAPGSIVVRFENEHDHIEFTPGAFAIEGRLSLPEPIFADAFSFLQSCVTSATAKLTIPSPAMVHFRAGDALLAGTEYATVEELFSALADCYQREIAALYDLGCRYLQLDDTSLAYLNDPAQRAEVAGRIVDVEHLHERYVELINASLAKRPKDLVVTTHLCRGNYRSSWSASGSYDYVAEAVFGGLDVDGFFLEFDDERSGGFEPLRALAPHKTVVLGLVTTKRPALEHRDELARRIEQAASIVPLEQLCLSPQCGFASTVEGNALTEAEQDAKLRLVVETAALVWGDR